MSFAGTISNALSGMRASSLAAELVSSNLANATNETYGPRSLQISSRVIGGVAVDGVERSVDKALLAEWRSSHSEVSGYDTTAAFLSRAERLLSSPDNPNSISAKATAFEAALVTAASRPDLTHRLESVISSARSLTEQISQAAGGLQELRSEADAQISKSVSTLNDKLERVAELNAQIITGTSQGKNISAIADLRQAALDEISELVSIRTAERDQGSVAVMTKSGIVLLDGTARKIDFSSTAIVTEHMSRASGDLSSLSMNGTEIDPSRLKSGRLAALFTLRDETFPGFQTELDAVARNLVTRFQDPSLDPTLGAADAGLFTDNGTVFTVANETGLSRRLEVNAAVDPVSGGETWKLRDGINATTSGSVGDGSILQSMRDVLTHPATIGSGKFSGQHVGFHDLSSNFLSDIGTKLTREEDRQSYAAAKNAELTQRKFQDGVDTDAELQTLLQIEKAYAANAKVLQTVDEMLDVLMGL